MAVGKSSAIERQAAYIIGIRNSEAYQKAKLLGSQIQKALLDKLAVHAIPCTDFTFEQWTEAINATVGAAAASPNSEVIVCVPAPRDTNHHHHPPNAPPPPQPAPNHHQHHPAPSAVSGSSGDRPAEVQAAVEAMTLGSGRVQLLSNRAQDFVHWAEEKFAAEIDFVEPSAEECASAAESETAQWMREKNHTFVQFDMTVAGKAAGALVIELYDDTNPLCASKFLALVEGDAGEGGVAPEYAGTKISRLVEGGWMQGGAIVGKDGKVVGGPTFEDENFIHQHSHRGTVSFANSGPHTNFSQFIVALRALPFLDKKYVQFGRLVRGKRVLDRLEKVPTRYEVPVDDIAIRRCTVLSRAGAARPEGGI